MKIDCVPFELAKKLKEKGFREKCLSFYYKKGGFQWNGMKVDKYLDSVNISWAFYCFNDIIDGEKIDAPSVAQVMKWLREEKNVMIEIPIHLMDGHTWEFVFRIQTEEFYESSLVGYNTWELAAIAAIELVVEKIV